VKVLEKNLRPLCGKIISINEMSSLATVLHSALDMQIFTSFHVSFLVHGCEGGAQIKVFAPRVLFLYLPHWHCCARVAKMSSSKGLI
jgi:hypothetical protein